MRSALFSLTILAGVAPVVPAWAQPADPPAHPTDPGEVAYQEGRRLYDLQEWDHAIAKFKEAYQLRSDAASLFNIAQSYRLKGDCVAASSFYKTYKRNFPTAPNIAKVDKFLTDLEACVAAAPPTAIEPTDPGKPIDVKPVSEPIKPVVVTPPVAITAHKDDDPGHGMRLAGIGVGVAGVVALGVGAVFGLKARKSSNDATNLRDLPWDPSLESSGTSDNTRAEIFLGLGGAALVAGGVLYYLGHRKGPESGISLVPRRDGGMMVWACEL